MSAGDAILRLLLIGEDKSASTALQKVGKEAETAGKKVGGIKDIAAGALTAGIASEATKAIVDFGKDSLEAYKRAEDSQLKLEDAFARFPALGDTNIEKLRDLNKEVQRKTGFDDDELAGAQAVLAQYKLTGDQVAQLTPLVADYAAKTGKDLPEAASDLGKAMLGQGRALKEVGINFHDTKTVAGNFQEIMTGLGTQVQGFAEKQADTLDGKMKILHTEFENVQESVGEKLLPALLKLADGGLKVIDWMTRNKEVLEPLVLILGTVAGTIGTVIGVTRAWTIAQGIFNAVMDANPISLIIIGIAALVAGLIYAYQHSEKFKEIVDTAFRAIGEAGKWLWENALKPAFDATVAGLKVFGEWGMWLWNNALQPVIKFIVQGFVWVTQGIAAVLRALGNIPGFGWAKDAADLMDAAAKGAQKMADGINKIPDKKNVDVSMNVTANYSPAAQTALALSRGTLKLNAMDNLPTHAAGGYAAAGQWSIVGENGPELFKPDTGGTVYTAGQTASMLSGGRPLGNGGVTIYAPITVQGDSDPLGAAKRIETKLMELSRSRGGGALNFKTI